MKGFKKVLSLSCALLLLTACSPRYKEGTYEGEGQGYNPNKKIKVSVTINSEKKISDVKIDDHAETDEIGGVALPILAKALVEKGTNNIDILTGATKSCQGFKEAVDKALEEAKK